MENKNSETIRTLKRSTGKSIRVLFYGGFINVDILRDVREDESYYILYDKAGNTYNIHKDKYCGFFAPRSPTYSLERKNKDELSKIDNEIKPS